ncbi:hypothetical protein [Tepidibacter aestuarii]|uniref:hypothetical protein n=1 Tax=Tepidibacter aestuarii TaxID=2925782 RepID=UPI0020C05213|nr:hypothetical protein [Tepidibacter aestuarii]CAH2215034.1 conserved exported protein of unknown function [Tepidibacter aestuarii]
MRKLSLFILIIFIAFNIMACFDFSPSYQEPDPNEVQEEISKDTQAQKRAQSKNETLKIADQDVTLYFNLYDDTNLEFTTYIPQDMLASSKEGDFLTIYSNFNNKKNKDAKITFFSPIKTVSSNLENMIKVARDNVTEDGFETTDQTVNDYTLIDDSDEEFDIIRKQENKSDIIGKVSIFNHNERMYYVIVQYPRDLEKEFLPRAQRIISDIMFYDEQFEENE